MEFDPDNNIVKLCAEGMNLEGQGNMDEANRLFLRAWSEAKNAFEKFTAAHYVARHQPSVSEKLRWDEAALALALQISDESVREALPSLYLNVANCYERLHEYAKARMNYESADSFAVFLPDDGYGNMIRSGIKRGLSRVE